MTLDRKLILTRCAEIAESCERLEEIAAAGKESFQKDRDRRDIASYRLLVAIEAALNICYHVCSKKLTRIPENYAQCFELLGEDKVITPELSERLQSMARFRNLLIHLYYRVDDEELYEIINNHLDDLRGFCRSMSTLD